LKLQGKVAIVTGASRGIGRAIAKSFAREGANVVINYNASETQASDLFNELVAGGSNAILAKADVSKKQEVKNMVDKTLTEWGRVDVLVNNAGILIPKDFLETTEEDFDRIIGVNLKGTFFCCQLVAPIMRRQGKGKIINIASVSALVQPSGLRFTDYVSSKAGIIGLTRSLAVNLGPNISVNAICPGTIETDIIAFMPDQTKKLMIDETLLKRLGKPEEIASAAVFLASDESDFITGEVITVGGGRGMR